MAGAHNLFHGTKFALLTETINQNTKLLQILLNNSNVLNSP